jgi:hypothetical protein
MQVVPSRCAVNIEEVFPKKVFILGGLPSPEFSDDRHTPKRQEQGKDTHQLVRTVRALDGNEEAARFRAEITVKITASQQPVLAQKTLGFPYFPAEFDGLTITPYVNAMGRVAYSFWATGMRAPTGATSPGTDTTARNAV